ncbi:alcohol dehydrogenase catalytic domain-containing protein [Phenylobacterium sp. LjRoot219]|uniref:alcohol dehydrogenase catalytic domain-containing protein n=1 Tax=Phenylobacterium sp. LjRoot219 TaxID=3342283 RepID=UPI003ECCAE9A
MKAWLFTGAHQPLQLIERETPRPGPGQAVIEVRGAGLCHSDVGVLDGTITDMLPMKPPLILGHEVAGVVVEVGPEVSAFRVGDRVVASGDEAFCPGWSADGGYATHCLLSTTCMVRLPDAVDFVQGAAATDAGQTSYGAVMGTGGLRAGQRVGIVGLGGLGMTGARIAVVNGAQVYAAEPRREAWDTARAQGVLEVVDDVLGLAPYELDLIVDFAGFGVTTAGAISAVRSGGLVVQVGLGRGEATISTAELVAKSVTLRGSKGGRPGDTEAVLAHMQKGELAIQATTIDFEEIPAGLDRLERGGVIGRLVAQPT